MKYLVFVMTMFLTVSCSKVVKNDDQSVLAVGDLALTLEEHMSNSATITWDYKGRNPNGFQILKEFSAINNPNAPAGLSKMALIQRVGSTERSFTDDSVKPGEAVKYVVRLGINQNPGIYSNIVGSGTAGGITPPVLAGPVVVMDEIVLTWVALADSLFTSFLIERNGSQIGTVAAVPGLITYTFTDDSPVNGYSTYKIIAMPGSIESNEGGIFFGIGVPGAITDFNAFPKFDSKDIIFEWQYNGPDCVFIFDMILPGGTEIKGFKQVNSTNPDAGRENGYFVAFVPFTQGFSDFAGQDITFKVYPMIGMAYPAKGLSEVVTMSASAYSLSAGTLSVSGGSLDLFTLNRNKSDGFMTNYKVNRKLCAEGWLGVQVFSGTFITWRADQDPFFREYRGSSSPSLQRTAGLCYDYRFTVYNGTGASADSNIVRVDSAPAL